MHNILDTMEFYMEDVAHSLGVWSDGLRQDEVAFTKKAAQELQNNASWSKKLLEDQQIEKALQISSQQKLDNAAVKRHKAALFEIRVALMLHKLNLNVEYEYKTNVGNSSVDFKVESNPSLLIELTSLRESDEIKKATAITQDYYFYMSTTSPNENAPEITDIIKAQHAIYHKVVNNEGKSIKFPSLSSNNIHIVVVDVRSMNIGETDIYDYYNIVYGSKLLLNVEDGVYCRSFVLNGKQSLIKGVFDDGFGEAKPIHDALHAIGFVNERLYDDEHLINNLFILPNYNIYKTGDDLKVLLPEGLRSRVVG